MPTRGTIVCIHGAGGNAEQWKHQIAHFSQHYRVIAPDLRGHDQSERPRSSYTLEEFLWDFTHMLEQLAIAEPFFLLAHSFGGPIGLTFAAPNPAAVENRSPRSSYGVTLNEDGPGGPSRGSRRRRLRWETQ